MSTAPHTLASDQLIGGPQKRGWEKPFHVVKKSHNDVHVGYDIYVNNQKFLVTADTRYPLKRLEAYAICRLLNKRYGGRYVRSNSGRIVQPSSVKRRSKTR